MQFSQPLSRSRALYFWRILLIDDDEDDYILIRDMLSASREGKFTLEWAATFESGKQILEADRGFDAVIVDYDIGLHTGTEIIRGAVAREYPAPLLLLTGRGTYEIDVEAMEAGAADYLSKSEINNIFLERAIRYAIERKKNELALRDGEARLRESKERYEELFNCMLNGFAVHEMIYDTNGLPIDYRFLEINPAFEKLTGLKRTEIIGKTVREVLPEIDPIWIEKYGKVAMNGEPIQFVDYATPLGKYYQVYAFCPRKHTFAAVFSDVTERLQTEHALRASEQRFRAIFENRHSIMLLIDPDTAEIVDANEAACAFYRWNRAELIGKKITDINILPPQKIHTRMDQAHSASSSVRFHFQHRLASGEVRDVEVRSGPVRIGDRRLLFSIIYDISEHVRTQDEFHQNEARLRESEKTFATAFQSSPMAIAITRLSDGRYMNVNDSLCQLLGYSCEELIGMNVEELGIYECAEDRTELLRTLKEKGSLHNFEKTIKNRAGVPLTALVSIDPIEVDQEKCLLVSILDITERKRTEEELRSSEAALRLSVASEQARAHELETLMDAVPAMIWISRDAEAKEVIGNRFGNEFLRMRRGANLSESAPPENVQEQPYRSYRDGREVPPDELPIQVTSATGEPARDYEFDMVFKDGSTYHLIGNVNPLFNEDGLPSGAVGAFTDVTLLRRLEAEKIEARAQIEVQHRLMTQREQERQTIARDIHDGPIQTLSSTVFHLQMVKEVYPDPALQSELSHVGASIKASIQELRAVLNELRPPALMHFGLSRVIRMYIEDLRDAHPAVNFELNVMDDARLLSDHACLTLFRVFQAGLNNTLKHSGASKVWVTYKIEPDAFLLELRDNGTGFAVKDFNLLAREGHFGLVGMKERVESVGGEFSIASTLGQGTTVKVRGPLLGKNIK